ncbi:MAG TPA: cysteine desulfurase family protein [Candidatus Saccharimonadales bacterium]
MKRQIYLDSAAATPLDERVFNVMRPFLFKQFYNPSSAYLAAREVRAAYEEARRTLAHYLGAKAGELILTAGATESSNIAIHGTLRGFSGAHIAVSAIEHQAVLEAAKQYDHTLIMPEPTGRITPEALRAAITDKTVLVSVGYINSEIGTLQSLRKLTAVVRQVREARRKSGNLRPLYFHTDASQAAGCADLHAAQLGVDLLTLSASKIYGPKQVGLLYAKTGLQLQPFMHGGGQEAGVRSGTENVAGVVGFSKALSLAQADRHGRTEKLAKLRDTFERTVLRAIPEAIVNGDLRSRAPHISHLSFASIDAETLLFMLDERGIMVATGAACAANKGTASHVLVALGLAEAMVQGSVRCSFSHTLSEADVRAAAEAIIACVQQLRSR